MSEVSEQLSEKVARIKKQLIGGQDLDSNGRYKVDEDKLILALCSIINEYRIALDSMSDLKELHEFENKLFYFQDLNTSLDWMKFYEKVKSKGLGDKFTSKSAHHLYNITFENCYFNNLHLRYYYNNLFSDFVLENCELSTLVCNNKFFEELHFRKTIFNRSTIHNLTFESDQKYRIPIIFRGCLFIWKVVSQARTFDYLKFEDCDFFSEKHKLSKEREVNGIFIFNNTKFHSTTAFESCNFHVPPKFHGTTFHSDTSFHKTKFLDIKSPEAIGDYRVLKQAMHDLGAEHDAMNFHALEMDARRKTVLPSLKEFKHPEWTASFSSWFLKITNDYGRNYWLPFIWLLGITFVFTCTYYFFNLVGCDSKNVHSGEIWQQEMCTAFHPNDLKISGAYSLQKSLGPISLFIDNGVLDAKTGWAKLMTVFQVMLSSIYWYIIIIQLRRQFRL